MVWCTDWHQPFHMVSDSECYNHLVDIWTGISKMVLFMEELLVTQLGQWNRIYAHCFFIWPGLLITWWLISKRKILKNKSSKRSRRKLQDLLRSSLEVKQYHFHHTSQWRTSPDLVCRGTTQGHKFRDWGHWGVGGGGTSCRLAIYYIDYKATASNYFYAILSAPIISNGGW